MFPQRHDGVVLVHPHLACDVLGSLPDFLVQKAGDTVDGLGLYDVGGDGLFRIDG